MGVSGASRAFLTTTRQFPTQDVYRSAGIRAAGTRTHSSPCRENSSVKNTRALLSLYNKSGSAWPDAVDIGREKMSTYFINDSAAVWWSTMVTFSFCEKRDEQILTFFFSLSIVLVTNYSERYMYLEAEKNSGVELDDGPVFPQTGMSPRV